MIVGDLHGRRGALLLLHGLNLTVPRELVVGLIGPSGCGETTLMRAIIGMQIVQSGTVTVLGRPAGSRSLRRRVGYVTQEASVYDDLTVSHNLQTSVRCSGFLGMTSTG